MKSFFIDIPKINDWVLYKEILAGYYGPEFDSSKNIYKFYDDEIAINYYPGKTSITREDYEQNYLNSSKEKKNVEEKFFRLYEEELKRFKQKKKLKIELNILEINEFLARIPLSKKNLGKYNDIAFFLVENQIFWPAIYLLEKIIKNYPSRIVAYINLGDAYYSLQKKKIAKKSYRNYVDLMKKKGKQKRIPKRVYIRLK